MTVLTLGLQLVCLPVLHFDYESKKKRHSLSSTTPVKLNISSLLNFNVL